MITFILALCDHNGISAPWWAYTCTIIFDVIAVAGVVLSGT